MALRAFFLVRSRRDDADFGNCRATNASFSVFQSAAQDDHES